MTLLANGDMSTGTYQATFDTWTVFDGPTTISARACDNWGNDHTVSLTDSNPATQTVVVDNNYPPLAPVIGEASYTSYTRVMVTWIENEEGDVSHYLLYRTEGGSEITANDLYATVAESAYSPDPLFVYYDDSLSSHTDIGYWKYAVRAVDNADNVSTFSQSVTVDPPDAPSGLIARAGNAFVNLRWNVVTEKFVEGYTIYRTEDGVSTVTYNVVWPAGSTAATLSFLDSWVQNGTAYEYMVRAYDGADNESRDSNRVPATPDFGAEHIDYVHVVAFEDLWSGVDWDYNDIVVSMENRLYLTDDDCVSTVALKATAIEKNAGYWHKVRLDIQGMVGRSSVTIVSYDASNLVTPYDTKEAVYEWGGEAICVFENTTDGVTGSGGVVGDVVYVTITLADPGSNPLATFDKPPFDAWININGSEDVVTHIFDPNPEALGETYFTEGQVVSSDYTALAGVFLGLGIKFPVSEWTAPSSGNYLWKATEYPYFVDYAKTVRSLQVRNATWYLYRNP